jgi:acetyl esterase/lipase
MASWQSRAIAFAIRVYIRRRSWGGDEHAVARRARRVFGSGPGWSRLQTRDVRIDPVHDGAVRGEWVTPRDPQGGAILYIHGGGYVSCSAATHRPITASLARRARRRVFAVDYRLAPEHRFPAALDDVLAAYRWLLDHGTPAAALALAGDSAGGGLVLAALVRLRDERLPLPSCGVCFSPWTDLAGSGESLRANDGRDAMFRPGNVPQFARAYLGDAPPLHPYASPVCADLGALPPILLQVGATELLLDDARRVHENVRRAGGSSQIAIVGGGFHGWHMFDGVVPEAAASLRQAADFIAGNDAVPPAA